jgi:probable F420-dependent oxidoreductase
VELGRVGIWTRELDALPTARAQAIAAELEASGWPTLWLPEAGARDGLTHATLQLSATERINVATGIARIHAHGAWATALTQLQLEDRFPGRFLLGLGVSHPIVVERLHGASYAHPLQQMSGFLDTLETVQQQQSSPRNEKPLPRVLAALGPKMLELAGARTSGAHTYMAPVSHTEWARAQLGAGPLLAPAVKAVLTTDIAAGRDVARTALIPTTKVPAYRSLLLRHGLTDDDLAPPLSDQLVDTLVAIGDEDVVAKRVQEHLSAGADHVPIEVLPTAPSRPPVAEWQRLAAALVLV